MARRVIQFPVRNAFAPERSYDSLARDPQTHTQRIAEQVENEIARKAERLASGRIEAYENARSYGVVTLRPASKFKLLRRRLAANGAKFRASLLGLFKRC